MIDVEISITDQIPLLKWKGIMGLKTIAIMRKTIAQLLFSDFFEKYNPVPDVMKTTTLNNS